MPSRINSGEVYFEDDYIVVNVDYEYNIGLSRIDTPTKLVWWLNHLFQKSWFEKNHAMDLIVLAMEKMNVDLRRVNVDGENK